MAQSRLHADEGGPRVGCQGAVHVGQLLVAHVVGPGARQGLHMGLLRRGEPLVPRRPVATVEAPPVVHVVEALVRVLEREERGQAPLEDARVVAAGRFAT